MRTFNLDSCRLIEDIYNGEVIVDLDNQPPIDNLEDWLRRYRSERRKS